MVGLAAQDEDLFVLNKPARLAVQGGSKGERHLDGMLHLFAEEGAERPRLVSLVEGNLEVCTVALWSFSTLLNTQKGWRVGKTPFFYIDLWSADILQSHVARTTPNRQGRAPWPFIGGNYFTFSPRRAPSARAWSPSSSVHLPLLLITYP